MYIVYVKPSLYPKIGVTDHEPISELFEYLPCFYGIY